MKFNNSSWFPLKKFSKSPMHFDWMLGCNTYRGVKDCLTGGNIKCLETVFWNRTKNANISLQNYLKVIKEKDENALNKLKDLELPTDIKI